MKRRLVALLVALMTMVGTAFAAEENTIDPSVSQLRWSTAVPYASAYLDDYSIAFGARDNCRMVITMDVNAVRVMDRIGCMMLIIENKIDGTWYECDTLVSADYPEFYMYNKSDRSHVVL